MEQQDWIKLVKTYSENWILGKRLRTFYNEKNEIVHCEDASINRDEILKGFKRLNNINLSKDKTKKQIKKSKKSKQNRDDVKKFKKQLKKKSPRK